MIGVALIGLIGIVAMNAYSGTPTVGMFGKFLEAFGLREFSFIFRITLLAIFAVVILVARTLLTIGVTKKGLKFLSEKTNEISNLTTSKYFNSQLPKLQQRTTQEAIFLMTIGINRLVLGMLGSVLAIMSDGFLILVMMVIAFIVDVKLAMATTLLFIVLFKVLRRFGGTKTTRLSSEIAATEIQVNSLIGEAIENFREITVRGVKGQYFNAIASRTHENAAKAAEIAFIPMSGKYIVEASLIIVTFSLTAFQLWLSDAKTAVATLALFLATGARITPAILRLQQGVLSIQASSGTSARAYSLIKELDSIQPLSLNHSPRADFLHVGFNGEICVLDVVFKHSPRSVFELKIEGLHIPPGKITAIVGPSGSGKSTLTDIILGILTPDSGRVEISGLTPVEVIKRFPGAISYIPQNVLISNTSIKENISFGYGIDELTEGFVMGALEIADLKQTIEQLPDGLDTLIGERGFLLSGGQRQRLGIARAVFTQPRLLVLDEATSSLDGQSEALVAEAITALKGKVTVVLIAHRLSTVRDADQVVYMDDGRVVAKGTFEEVRRAVPNFDTQAQLMGL